MSTDLEQIKTYWNKKYPNVFVMLSSNQSSNRFYGRMIGNEKNINLNADTIGELISQGEDFLRKLK